MLLFQNKARARITADTGKLNRVNLFCQGALEILVLQREELFRGKKSPASLKKNLYFLMKFKTEQMCCSECELYVIGLLVAN